MGSFVDFAFPAGEESDASNDEWDIGGSSGKNSSCIKNLDAVLHSGNDVAMLKQAISQGDSDAVEQLLDKGVDVETRLGFEWTPLMYAVSVANYHLAKLLLDRGASANFSKDHWTVLMASCTSSAGEDQIVRCVELLLSRNADPNMLDRSRMTCLMLAAREGYCKIINVLVSHGAEINIQDSNGYTALSIAVQFGREEAVLKLLQLGADKSIRTNHGKSPADLAELFKHTQIARILASSSHLTAIHPSSSVEDNLSQFLKTNTDSLSFRDCETKLDGLKIFLHGLDLGYLVDIMTDNDITWSYLLTMEKEDFDKIGITDLKEQQKLMNAVQQMQLDIVDLDSISHLGAGENGSEDLQNFLLTVSQQCCYLTEIIQDVITRFPRQTSQLVLSLDPKKEARIVCNQLVVQSNNLHKEVICLRSLLCQMDEAKDCCQLPQPGSQRSWRSLTGVAVGALGATFLLLLCRAAGGHSCKQMFRNVL